MRATGFLSVILLAGGMALAGSPVDDDSAKPATATKSAETTPGAGATDANNPAIPPVLRSGEKDDTTIVTLPGGTAPLPAADASKLPKPAKSVSTAMNHMQGPPALPVPDPDRPVLRRGSTPYPPEFGTESAIFCQKQIGAWTQKDAIALLGDPKGRRPSVNDEGTENGDILAFFDPSSRYRTIELDFERDTGTLRTVFVYPWKMTWQDCRKVWGNHVSVADANKGRMFYSYLDRRLDVLVDSTGNVISIGLY